MCQLYINKTRAKLEKMFGQSCNRVTFFPERGCWTIAQNGSSKSLKQGSKAIAGSVGSRVEARTGGIRPDEFLELFVHLFSLFTYKEMKAREIEIPAHSHTWSVWVNTRIQDSWCSSSEMNRDPAVRWWIVGLFTNVLMTYLFWCWICRISCMFHILRARCSLSLGICYFLHQSPDYQIGVLGYANVSLPPLLKIA